MNPENFPLNVSYGDPEQRQLGPVDPLAGDDAVGHLVDVGDLRDGPVLGVVPLQSGTTGHRGASLNVFK